MCAWDTSIHRVDEYIRDISGSPDILSERRSEFDALDSPEFTGDSAANSTEFWAHDPWQDPGELRSPQKAVFYAKGAVGSAGFLLGISINIYVYIYILYLYLYLNIYIYDLLVSQFIHPIHPIHVSSISPIQIARWRKATFAWRMARSKATDLSESMPSSRIPGKTRRARWWALEVPSMPSGQGRFRWWRIGWIDKRYQRIFSRFQVIYINKWSI